MTLEQLFKTSLVRIALLPMSWVVAAASAFFPSVQRHIAKKMRELFSPRLNDLLYENLFLYNRRLPRFVTEPRFINTNTPIPLGLELEMKDYVQAHFYFHGMPAFFLELLAFCDKQTAFFDLGANMGIISAGLARFLPPRNLVAVEAMPETYKRLLRVFDANCPAARAFNVALSSKSGELDFHIPDSDSGSASASESQQDLIFGRDSKVGLRTEKVKCTTFDDFYCEVDRGELSAMSRHAFKIDVEGHELELLRGMQGYFAAYPGEILMIIEVRQKNAPALHEFLSQNGFVPNALELSAERADFAMRDCIYSRERMARPTQIA